MTTAEPHDLTGAYAAGALEDGPERQAFERHLAGCPDCRREVRGLREAAAALALATGGAPPPELRARVLATIAATPQLRPVPAPVPSRRGPRLLLAAAAVVLLAGLGAGVTGAVQLQQAERERARAERILSVLTDPRARRFTAAVRAGGTVTVLLARSQAVLVTSGMQPLAADRGYQLWLVRPGRTSSAGLGPSGSAGSGSWTRPVDGVREGDTIAISVEPRGGSDRPSTTPIVLVRV